MRHTSPYRPPEASDANEQLANQAFARRGELPALLPISRGGTGQTTANAALNALLPTQATHSGEFLTSDGTNTSWAAVSSGSTAPRKIAVYSTLRV